MAAPQRNRSDDETPTRDHILAVALEAFSELGFDGASTRTIAARAGVNQGLIPYYFGTKETLWREAVDRASEREDDEAPPLRPFGLVLHHDGRWSHEGQPILNRKLREHFDVSVCFLEKEQKYVVRLGHFRGEID